MESRTGDGGYPPGARQKEIMIHKRSSSVFAAVFACALAAAISAALHAQTATASRTRAHVERLASAQLEGRLTGSAGEQLAAQYIASELGKLGARPLPGQPDFQIAFDFTAGTRDGGSSIMIASQSFVTGTTNVRALSFSDNGDVTGEVVFAGYGIVVPDGQGFAYDSYATLDVKDKIVLVLRYFPEDAEQKTKAILSRYADLRYKALAARQRGAKAMLVVTGPRSPNAGETVPMTFDTAIAGSGIIAASISGGVANALFDAVPGKTLRSAQEALDSASPHETGFPLTNVTVTVRTNVIRQRQTAHNVVAYLPATGSSAAAKPWIVLGAHYDHLGHGTNGNSLAGKDESGQIHFGADDNASGSAAVLAAGAALAARPRARNVVLAFWSGEELGLLGSAAFIARPPIAVDQIAAYFNFDMVGRMQDNKLTIQATGSSPEWAKIIEQANVLAGFDLQLQADPYQPTDVFNFNAASVPSLAFFTGVHTDYHRPTDTADKINYDDLDRVVDFAASIVARVDALEAPPAFTKVDQTTQPNRGGVRIFTGTIPDYSSEAKGLLLSGVVGGGPAEAAGLQKGDVIVEIAGQTIANIYDYTYALDLLKIGQPAKVVYLRGSERRETMLTPAARK
jgi:hypothetical protein